MTQRSPGHPPWNVPAELNNEEVITDSCDSSFSGNVRAETESQGRRSRWRQARGAAGGVGTAHCCRRAASQERGSCSWAFVIVFLLREAEMCLKGKEKQEGLTGRTRTGSQQSLHRGE